MDFWRKSGGTFSFSGGVTVLIIVRGQLAHHNEVLPILWASMMTVSAHSPLRLMQHTNNLAKKNGHLFRKQNNRIKRQWIATNSAEKKVYFGGWWRMIAILMLALLPLPPPRKWGHNCWMGGICLFKLMAIDRSIRLIISVSSLSSCPLKG